MTYSELYLKVADDLDDLSRKHNDSPTAASALVEQWAGDPETAGDLSELPVLSLNDVVYLVACLEQAMV